MSPLQSFRFFSKLPAEVQERIWLQNLSVPGLQVSVMTVTEKVEESLMDEESRLAEADMVVPQRPGLTSHAPPRMTVGHCRTDDPDSWGKYSTLSRLQEVATASRGSRDAVQLLLRQWAANRTLYKPLIILAPALLEDSPSSVVPYPGTPGTPDLSWKLDVRVDGEAIAVIVPPLDQDICGMDQFFSCVVPDSVQTIYVLDMTFPLHLRLEQLQQLKLDPRLATQQQGPWVGHNFAFAAPHFSHPCWQEYEYNRKIRSQNQQDRNGASSGDGLHQFLDKVYRWKNAQKSRRMESTPQGLDIDVGYLCPISLLPNAETPSISTGNMAIGTGCSGPMPVVDIEARGNRGFLAREIQPVEKGSTWGCPPCNFL